MAQQGAAWLSRVQRGSDRVRRGSSQGAAWLIRVRRGSVGSASGCCKSQLGIPVYKDEKLIKSGFVPPNL